MDREINERAVTSTGAQRQEGFLSDEGAAKLSSGYSVCAWIRGKRGKGKQRKILKQVCICEAIITKNIRFFSAKKD